MYTTYDSNVRHHPQLYTTTYRHNPSPIQQPVIHNPPPSRVGVSFVNQTIPFVGGQHAGHNLRSELIEIQKADLGRKYARVDRRPLDPPPAVLLKLFYVFNVGTSREEEKEVENYDEIQNIGLLCNVDLFPVPGPNPKEIDWRRHESGPSLSPPPPPPPLSDSAAYHSSVSSPQRAYTFVSSNPYPSSSHHPLPPIQPLHVPTQSMPSYPPPPPHPPQDVVYHVGEYPVTESSKQTHALVGATFVQPAIVDYHGKKALVFVFADLAVKIEGSFILRYRVFDIFSRAQGITDLVVQAECYGGPFRVYSTKEFPGLQASTELTKQLARWGVRLNIRETERRRRKRQTSSPPYPGSRKNKKGSSPNENAEEDDEDESGDND